MFGALVIALIGFFAGSRTASGGDSAASATTTTVATTAPARADEATADDPGPRRDNGVVRSGYSRTEAGARTATATYLATVSELMALNGPEAEAAFRTMTTAANADALLVKFSDDYGMVRTSLAAASELAAVEGTPSQLDGVGLFHYVPVGVQTVSYTNEAATVQVWGLNLAAVDGVSQPLANWEIATVGLRWEQGDWKVAAWESVPGPTPAWAPTATTTTSEFITAVTQYEPLGFRAK